MEPSSNFRMPSCSCSVLALHGWAANAHVFDALLPHLETPWRNVFHARDLAGHGQAAFDGTFSLEAEALRHLDYLPSLTESAAHQTDACHLVGWSLGGHIALLMALLAPEKVRSLTLVSSFARFAAAPDYPEGLSTSHLRTMKDLFTRDFVKYMRQFIELQLIHTPAQRALIDTFTQALVQYGTPKALGAALESIFTADARHRLPAIQVPVLLLYGEKDSITPLNMAHYLARHLKNSTLITIPKAAHAPFLSHPTETARALQDFWNAS